MRAVVVSAPGVVDLATVEDAVPGADEVVVKVAAVGLCGTDLHIADGHHGELPVIPGHEFAGTVAAIGAGVVDLRPGDRVAVDPNLPCRSCPSCQAGRANLCRRLGALGVTTAGAAAELVAAPASSCVVLPHEVDLVDAALVEPLSCAVHAVDVLRARIGATVLVYGAGTMGLMLLQLAQRCGASAVDVVEPNVEKLARAASVGCTNAVADPLELDRPEGWDVVVDASGAPAAISNGLSRVADGGTFLQFGVTAPEARVEFSPYDVYRREITITGSMAVHQSFRRAVHMLSAGFIDPKRYVTRTAPLADYQDALAAFRRGEGLKTLVLPTA